MKELSWKEVSVRLKALRKHHKLTIEKLAERIEVSSSFIGLIEKGESGVSLENLYKLAQLYNCSLDYLVSGKENAGTQDSGGHLARLNTAFYDFTEDEISFVASLAGFLRDKITVKQNDSQK